MSATIRGVASYYIWTKGGDSYPGSPNSRDTVIGVDGRRYTSDQATIWRWRKVFQHDFSARMDWSLKEFKDANHNPVAVVNGDSGKEPLVINAKVGTPVTLSAAGTSTDPSNGLVFEALSEVPPQDRKRGHAGDGFGPWLEPPSRLPRSRLGVPAFPAGARRVGAGRWQGGQIHLLTALFRSHCRSGGPALAECGPFLACFLCDRSAAGSVVSAFDGKTESQCPHGRLYFEPLTQALAVAVLSTVCDEHLRKTRAAAVPPGIRRAIQYLETDFANDFSIAELAALAQLSRSHYTWHHRRSRGWSISSPNLWTY